MLQEKTNAIEIVGYLSEVDLKEGSKNNKDYIAGTIKVKTEEEINGVMTPIEIPISVFSNRLTNAGNDNPAYESLKNVQEKMTSIAACGSEEGATRVRIAQGMGSLRENTFVSPQTKTLVDSTRINGSFFNIANPNQDNTARFETVIFILNIKDEVDRNGDTTGRLIIQGAFPDYNGKLHVVPYVVGNKDAVQHISSFWNKGDTVKVYGKIAYTFKTESFKEEVGFGEPIERKRTISKKEFLITSGSPQGFDETEAFNAEDIKAGLIARKAAQDKMLAEPAPRTTKNTTPTSEQYGF